MQFSVRASLDQFTLPHPAGTGNLKISVAEPAGLDAGTTDAPVPVLYVVDSDIIFGIAAEIARAMASIGAGPVHYVVGIGYDAAYADFLKLRTADLTPPIGAEAQAGLGKLGAMIGAERNGGADALLGFIADALNAEIASRYPRTAGGERILFGHSLGGLFAANALLTRPDAFSAYIVSSPSLWWDGFSILGKLASFGERLRAQPRVFVDVGGKEQDEPQSVPPRIDGTLEEVQAQIQAARMVDAAAEFADALKAAGLSNVRHVAFAEDDHSSVVPAALVHGMRFALPS